MAYAAPATVEYGPSGLAVPTPVAVDPNGAVRRLTATETTVAAAIEAAGDVRNGAPTKGYSTTAETHVKDGAQIHVVEAPPPRFWRAAPAVAAAPSAAPKGKGRGKGAGAQAVTLGVVPSNTGYFGPVQRGVLYHPGTDATLMKAGATGITPGEAVVNAGLRRGITRTLSWLDLVLHGLTLDAAKEVLSSVPEWFMLDHLMKAAVPLVEPILASAHLAPGAPDGQATGPWAELNDGTGILKSALSALLDKAAQMAGYHLHVGGGGSSTEGFPADYATYVAHASCAGCTYELACAMVWLSVMPSAVLNNPLLHLPSEHTVGAAVPEQHQAELPNDAGWSARRFMASTHVRTDEVVRVSPDTVIGAGAAADLTDVERSTIDAVSALWPHIWVLYGAHCKRTIGHVMVTQENTPEFLAVKQVASIVLAQGGPGIIAALKASSAHDGPHPFEPIGLTTLGHFAWSDEGFMLQINAFAVPRYPFKEPSMAALDACLSAFMASSSPLIMAMSADNAVAKQVKVLVHRISNSLQIAKEDQTRYRQVWTTKLVSSTIRAQRSAKIVSTKMLMAAGYAMFETFYSKKGAPPGSKPHLTALDSLAWESCTTDHPDVYAQVQALMAQLPAATADMNAQAVGDRLTRAMDMIQLDWDNGAGATLVVGKSNGTYVPATLVATDASKIPSTFFSAPASSYVALPNLAGEDAPETATTRKLTLQEKVVAALEPTYIRLRRKVPLVDAASALAGMGSQQVASALNYSPRSTAMVLVWVAWVLASAPAEVWRRDLRDTVFLATACAARTRLRAPSVRLGR